MIWIGGKKKRRRDRLRWREPLTGKLPHRDAGDDQCQPNERAGHDFPGQNRAESRPEHP